MNLPWNLTWKKQLHSRLRILPFILILALFLLISIYAPLLAFGKPLIAQFEGNWYLPLFRYLLYKGTFSKPIDLFFNLIMLSSPLMISLIYFKAPRRLWLGGFILFLLAFAWVLEDGVKNPANRSLSPPVQITADQATLKPLSKQKAISSVHFPDWDTEWAQLNAYARFNLVWERLRLLREDEKIRSHLSDQPLETPKQKTLQRTQKKTPQKTPWSIELERHQQQLLSMDPQDPYRQYLVDRWEGIGNHLPELSWTLDPWLRPFFWEENTGKDQQLNPQLPWYERARINRKDLVAALIYGTRVSFVVGILTVILALAIGIPMGAISGYWAGRWDMILMRLIEIWEAFPTFFMLLFITAILQSKSILLVILILGIFNWTGFARYVRGEVLRQKQMPYCEACRSQGLSSLRILFSQILPNAISPVLTLLPFAVMNAMTSEAGLSFLGLGEEGSCSWGTLMDEGRLSFPAESYLLWPPALALSFVLVSIAVVGDWIHEQLDPKLKDS